ncbi:2167_t:CDS:2 [Funneliformis geosporum]|uniref:2167_t:CDS:1 n=1 Tax=Funneliformis geosporum TaxID=1117311 RepID=A0A9W4T585_9GLOM|nr:2167_t:CDS:2 [Funneliformis geosporum]
MLKDLSINEWDIIIIQVESLFRIEFTARLFVAILDKANAIMYQISNAFTNKSTLVFLKAYRGEDILIVDNRYQPRVNEMVEILYDLNSEAKVMRIGYEFLRQGKRVAFVSTRAVMARALVEKAYKLSKPDNSPVRAHAYYGNMDGKQRQKDFSNINDAWSELDCVAYTNIVEAGISFKITGHFDIVIAITNIATPVHIEALAQMFYRICHENIRAELETDESPASYSQYRVSLQIMKVDESQKVIGNRKKVCNEIRVEALVIKEADFNEIATSQNLDSEEAEVLKFDQECHDEENAMKGLKAEENKQWKIACYKAEKNLEKLVAKDLRKSYSAKH